MAGDSPMTQLRDRETVSGSVAFLRIPGFGDHDATTTLRTMQALHGALADLRELVPARVFSALTGAIVVLLDRDSEAPLHTHLGLLSSLVSARGVPIRAGVTHGELEALVDADGLTNLIGPMVNIAARLAYAAENTGCLYNQSYVDSVRGYAAEADTLAPHHGERIEATGKAHDAKLAAWNCPAFVAAPKLDESKLRPPPVELPHARGVILAYDLPRFSSGDRAELSTRFRSVIDALRQLKAEQNLGDDDLLVFSPGGDGGVLLLPMEKGPGYRTATDLVERLRIESDNKRDGTGVLSRVGLHYGQVSLYVNAEGVFRPTGPEILLADAIASGVEAGSGVVFSGQFRDVVTAGNSRMFEASYEELPALETGSAAGVSRFTRRQVASVAPGPGGPSPTPGTEADQAAVGIESTIVFPGGGILQLAAHEAQEVQARVQLSAGSSPSRLKVKIRIRVYPPDEQNFDKSKFTHQGPAEIAHVSTEPDLVTLQVPGLPEGHYLLVAKVTNEDERFAGSFDPDHCWTCKAISKFTMPFIRG